MEKGADWSLSLTLFHVFYSTILGEKAVQNLRAREEREFSRQTHTIKHTDAHTHTQLQVQPAPGNTSKSKTESKTDPRTTCMWLFS